MRGVQSGSFGDSSRSSTRNRRTARDCQSAVGTSWGRSPSVGDLNRHRERRIVVLMWDHDYRRARAHGFETVALCGTTSRDRGVTCARPGEHTEGGDMRFQRHVPRSYQSSCGESASHFGHCVSFQDCGQLGQAAPVTNVSKISPHTSQPQCFLPSCFQPQRGHRMVGFVVRLASLSSRVGFDGRARSGSSRQSSMRPQISSRHANVFATAAAGSLGKRRTTRAGYSGANGPWQVSSSALHRCPASSSGS
jgi:hypothetical protein